MVAMILCALLLAYPLSLGPVCRYYWMRPEQGFPASALAFYTPVEWASNNIPLFGIAFNSYLEIWLPKSSPPPRGWD